jgi:hypothetical protein
LEQAFLLDFVGVKHFCLKGDSFPLSVGYRPALTRTRTSTRERNNVLTSSYRNSSVDTRNNRFLVLFPSGKCQPVSGQMTQTGSDSSFFDKFLLQKNVAN